MKKIIEVKNLNLFYGSNQALKNLNLDIYKNEILAIIGPANSGKSTFLRVINRLVDLVPMLKIEGKVYINGINIFSTGFSVPELRKRVGMIFAVPVPLPMSIFDNITYGVRLHGIYSKDQLKSIVRESLEAATLWDEVKDRLEISAMKLSGGQQQRLCLARALAVAPDIILFDEPCSGLDPISTAKVEKTMLKLKKKYTIILVTNNTKQAARVSDRTAFFLKGELIEVNRTKKVFTAPHDKRTDDYITGKFG